MRSDFAVFILCYGRPENCISIETLNKANYTGKYYLVCSSDDPKVDEYIEKYNEKVLVFNKKAVKFDKMDNFKNRKCVVYARNVCFDLANKLGIKYFLELDDDYYELCYRYIDKSKLKYVWCREADKLFEIMIELLNSSDKIKSVALAQGGDYIGGIHSSMVCGRTIRKCMNSFFCDTSKRFNFNGTFNEDVNTYTNYQSLGNVFLTVQFAYINQVDTQSTTGGMHDIYNEFGTYTKSFYSVIGCPSAVKISAMGVYHYRLHHQINWNRCVPKIISSKYKKL